ncbi:MAG TPA: PAC2 family protein [Chloroflexota bacterium]|jgi:proteasome assembly chaperone (PAC2) family protein|nr:PAC2 family protein [Chloroflexota bacterium]
MEHLRVSERPELRNPVMVAAFAGWNDAAGCATAAVRALVDQWHARKFADIDPEEFYTFQRFRPQIRLDADHNRHIEWSNTANDFYFYRTPELDHDIILFIGVEPSLKWRTFSTIFTQFAHDFGVSYVVMMGALITDTVHTVPVPVSGSSNDSDLRQRISSLFVRSGTSSYEGNTGILSVIMDACQTAGVKTMSMWGAVPHYISQTPNPKVVVSLLRHLRDFARFELELDQLDAAARRFEEQVNEAVAGNDQLKQYIREKEQHDRPSQPEDAPHAEDFPTSETVIESLEEFLRQNRLRPPSSD